MKHLITIIILCLSIGVKGQTINLDKGIDPPMVYDDSLTAERFFEDSLHNTFIVEYRYADKLTWDTKYKDSAKEHEHYIALCTIIKYHGNKSQKILTMKAIYSPTECSSDNTKLWLQRLYNFQNNKK